MGSHKMGTPERLGVIPRGMGQTSAQNHISSPRGTFSAQNRLLLAVPSHNYLIAAEHCAYLLTRSLDIHISQKFS